MEVLSRGRSCPKIYGVVGESLRRIKSYGSARMMRTSCISHQSEGRMPERRVKVNRPISPILTLKLVAMATFLERSEKESPNAYRKPLVKIW